MFKANLRRTVTSLISFSLIFLLVACDQTSDIEVIGSAASQFTLDSNLELAETLDIENQVDFENAKRGLIAKAPVNKLNKARGAEIWNAESYDFVKGDAPDTVNPSLWRQAKLNSIRGLFEVEKGLYQLRGFDLANMSLIKSDNGWIVVDPLTTLETSRFAMDFAEQHLGPINITGVIFTHSHVDHFGGVLALLDAQQVADKNIPIIAPVGFVHEAVSENIIAGPAMLRRGSYMYGESLDISASGHVDTGLGKQVIFGSTSILQPSILVDQPRQTWPTQNLGRHDAQALLEIALTDTSADKILIDSLGLDKDCRVGGVLVGKRHGEPVHPEQYRSGDHYHHLGTPP